MTFDLRFSRFCVWVWHTHSQWRRNEFEVGDTAKVGGAPIRKTFFVRPPLLFGSRSTISRFGEHFRDGQYSLVSFLFAVLLLTVPPVPSHQWWVTN